METPNCDIGEATPAKVYRDLTPEDLLSLLVSGSRSFEASHEQHPLPVDHKAVQEYNPATNYFEQHPIHHGDNETDNGVMEATAAVLVPNKSPSTGYQEEKSSLVHEKNMPDQVDGQTDEQVLDADLATNITGTTTVVNAVQRSRTGPIGGPYTCRYCGVQHPKLKAHRSHMVCHEPPQLRCSTCGKATRRQSDLVKHMKLHEENWVCNGTTDGPCGDEGCGRVFTRKYKMVRHWDSLKKAQENQ